MGHNFDGRPSPPKSDFDGQPLFPASFIRDPWLSTKTDTSKTWFLTIFWIFQPSRVHFWLHITCLWHGFCSALAWLCHGFGLAFVWLRPGFDPALARRSPALARFGPALAQLWLGSRTGLARLFPGFGAVCPFLVCGPAAARAQIKNSLRETSGAQTVN